MRNDCKLWREGALKRSLQKFSVYANVSSGLLGKVCMKLDIENPIIRINTAFKGCSSLEKISVLPRIYHN